MSPAHEETAGLISRSVGRLSVAFDLDKTLATYDGWRGFDQIGEPIDGMVRKAKWHLAQGHKVYVFTARMSPLDHTDEERQLVRAAVEAWCLKHIGTVLPVTGIKLTRFSCFYDDKAISVLPNQGITLEELLTDILNCIHHDTGQHTQAVGLQQSVRDAMNAHACAFNRGYGGTK